MNVASLEHCKELYELSGWESDWMYWKRLVDDYDQAKVLRSGAVTTRDGAKVCAAYDLGYLLRKLQESLPEGEYVGISADNDTKGRWFASVSTDHSIGGVNHADIPEDAACKLAIELFKQGILKKESPL